MNYSSDEQSCRVDIFKPSGKWYMTIGIKFLETYWYDEPRDALYNAIHASKGLSFCNGMTAVCLEPYTKHSYPVIITL